MRKYYALGYCLFFTMSIAYNQTASIVEQVDALMQKENYEKANQLLKILQSNYLKENNLNKYLNTSTQIAVNLQNVEDYATSLVILQEALAIPNIETLPDSILAPAYHKLGVAQFFEGNDSKAISNWEKALVLRKNYLPKSHIDIIKGYRNIGKSYLFLQDWEKAKFNLQYSLDLQLKTQKLDTLFVAETHNVLGYALTKLEDFNQAEKHLERSLDLYQSIYGEDEIEYSDVYENFFALYQKNSQPDRMIEYAQKVVHIFEHIEDKTIDDYEILAINYNNLSVGYDLNNQIDKAIEVSKLALINIKKSGVSAAEIYTNQSFLYRKTNELQLALNSIEEAIKIDKTSENLIGEVESLNSKAVILGLMNNYPLALTTIEQAISKISKQEYIFDKPLYIIVLNDKADLLRKMYAFNKQQKHLEEATTAYKKIIETIDAMRTDYLSDASKSFLTKKSKKILEKALELNIELFDITADQQYLGNAFEIIERSKSIILFDALQEAQAKRTTNIPSKILERENEIKLQIAKKEKALFEDIEADVIVLNNDLINLNRTFEKLRDSIEENYPNYYAAKYEVELPAIANIKKILSSNMLEYFVGDSTIYIFKLTKDQANIEYVKVPLDFPLANWIKQLREGIYKPHLQKLRSDEEETKYAQDLVNIAYQLHQKLIAPIIKASEPNEKLIIIPDGILGYIPFDVLITKLPEDATLFGAHDYLINDFQISYAYSATSLLEMQKKSFSATASNNFTAFAPTFEGKNEVAFVRSIDVIRGELSPLEFNIPEVEAIQQLIGGNLFTGLAATRANFIHHAANSKIVHLATHGKANDDKGDYAFLAFTDTKDSIDFKLYNRDLYNLALNADMVVLSACETGIGELQKGEGIISLARGFSYAGAKSIVTTLWSINDNRTKEIMENFYGNLKAGETKDMALRNAKLKFIENYSHNAHPFFWAAFIPIGDMGAIELGNNWDWRFGIIGFVCLLCFLFWYKKN